MVDLKLKNINYLLIVKLVLEKIPWLNNSPNHLSISDLFKKFLLSLISLDPTYITTVYKSLIKKIIPS